MSRQKQALGRWGEQQAADYLAQRGYQILGRNLHGAYGEIDLLARHQGTLVFIEVKTRTSARFGLPEEAITPAKQQHLIHSAEEYLQAHPELAGDWRIDVVSILRQPGGAPQIQHFENAVQG
ncbi:MAG: YraN family protein [Anaerolineales bacterium]|nr:YraN family protein [Anaerolineales bacterium]MCW5854978.1 YraN family protein [Anaerolineales bacterium]